MQRYDSTGVVRRKLDNGLEVLIYPYNAVPWVATQLWYRVGSKHEQDGTRGAAHLLEHMLFKGTSSLSELDINAITDKLGGYANAFTSHDYTAYVFDFPRVNWEHALTLLADCMSHATIKADLLHAEIAAVIQELRLYRDNYESTLEERLTSDVFSGHPYHHPIIGYKRDLWSIEREALIDFYKRWYVPNNAVLVIVGDVAVEQAYDAVARMFGNIPAGNSILYTPTAWSSDMVSRSVAMMQEVHQLYDVTAFPIPGGQAGLRGLFDAFGYILANGNGSRLYKRLVRASEKALSVEAGIADLSEYDLFFVRANHAHENDRAYIRAAIHEELASIASQGLQEQELVRACAMARMDHEELFQDMQELAIAIGQGFITTGNEQLGIQKPCCDVQQVGNDIQQCVRQWFSQSQAHYGALVAIDEKDESLLRATQEAEDAIDEAFLAARVRTSSLEPLVYTPKIHASSIDTVNVPQAYKQQASNGTTVITCATSTTDTIVLLITFPAQQYHEQSHQQGVAQMAARLLKEGTQRYSADEFADFCERKGMVLATGPGFVSLTLLRDDYEDGITLLTTLLSEPRFDQPSFNRVRTQLLAELDELWDDPYSSVDEYARYSVYGDHPYGCLSLSLKESLKKMTVDDVWQWHRYAHNVRGAQLAIVGAINDQILHRIMEVWQTVRGSDLEYPMLPQVAAITDFTSRSYKLYRDQTALCYAGLSVTYTDPWYEPLLLLDQIVCGGELNSMHSLLFQVREQTGLFYTIQGSTLLNAGTYPGMVKIKTLVSPDRLEKAHKAITQVLATVPEHITAETLQRACTSIVSARLQYGLSNYQLATLFIAHERLGLPLDYAALLPQRLAAVTVEQAQQAAIQFLSPKTLVRVTVGR